MAMRIPFFNEVAQVMKTALSFACQLRMNTAGSQALPTLASFFSRVGLPIVWPTNIYVSLICRVNDKTVNPQSENTGIHFVQSSLRV